MNSTLALNLFLSKKMSVFFHMEIYILFFLLNSFRCESLSGDCQSHLHKQPIGCDNCIFFGTL